MAQLEGQQHPIGTYLWIWGWLFVLSAFSYLVDYLQFQGAVRWTLILTFMMLKAGLIMAFFMHLKWERMALVYALLIPMFAVMVFVGIMVWESDYTLLSRLVFYATGT